MMKNKNKIFFSVFFLLVFALGGCYFIQRSEADKVRKNIVEIKKDNLEKEDLEIEIINEVGSQSSESEIEEEVLEDDAEKLSVNEEEENSDTRDLSLVGDQDGLGILPAPLKKNSNSDTIKIGFMTDLHVRSQNGSGFALEDFYAKKINYFVEKMNNSFVPNFIILNGDIIEGTRTDSEIGAKELSMVKKLFDRTIIKKYWVVGNHDLRSVNKKQWEKALDIDYTSKSFNIGNYKIIILDSNFTKDDKNVSPGRDDYDRGKVSQKQIEWLKKEIEKTNKKVIVFMHHPPLRDIEAKMDVNLLYNANELQEIFSQYGVLAVFSGHIEDLYYQEIGGVDYYVSPGMVKYPKYLGAFSEITIKGKKISINLNYLKEDGTYRTIEIEK